MDPLRRLPEQRCPADDMLPGTLQRYVTRLYYQRWRAYVNAGCPFGHRELAMLIWAEFDRHTLAN